MKGCLKKSVLIAGRHSTSITIEKEFMEELVRIVSEQSTTINALVTEIDKNRTGKNLSSAIRIYILEYIKKAKSI